MPNRREGGRTVRVSSPFPTSRRIRLYDAHNSLRDDHVLDPRLLGREASSKGIGKASSSAPGAGGSGLALSFTGKSQGNHQRSMDFPDNSVNQTSSHVMNASATPRDPSPRNKTPSSGPPGFSINGEGTSSHQLHHGRPRSSIESQPGAYLCEPSNIIRYSIDPRRRDHSPSDQGQPTSGPVSDELLEGSMISDEAMSSVTTTAEGVARALPSGGFGLEVMEGSFTCDDGFTWHSALTCYVCGQLFRRPRILPCGHTFCSECLVQLKDEVLQAGKKVISYEGHTGCSVPSDSRNKADIAMQFVCPIPDCRYAMRLINLSRWSTRNKTVTEVVTTLRKMYECRQDASTQTEITNESVLVTIPRSFIQGGRQAMGSEGRLSRSSSSSLVDRVVHRALSMDCLSQNYIPQRNVTWRSYVAMLGMHILQQVVHT